MSMNKRIPGGVLVLALAVAVDATWAVETRPALAAAATASAPACVAPMADDLTVGGMFFYASDYGQLLSEPGGPIALWWCDATRKVPRKRVLPVERGAAVQLEAARNEFEAAQIVVQPQKALAGLTAKASEFAGPTGAKIPVENVQLLRVGYVPVNVPTDKRGLADLWPDPLPPLDGPVDVPAGENQPIWVLVHVPKDSPPGDYQGKVALNAEGWSAEVPVRLHVWDFALPDRPSVQSGFGLNVGAIARYHGLKTEQDKRAVFAKYMQSFADHRISPYDPVPFDPIGFSFQPDATPPRCDVDFSRFDPAMAEAVGKYHITSFMLHVPGMGSGTFYDRVEGQIAGFRAGTPEYEAMMSGMLGRIQEHLREKGWLDLAYSYWFDEPEEKDYPFVRAGMERLKKYAPHMRRLLTEQPAKELFDVVNLWCPVSRDFEPVVAAERMAKGEQFWWYLCCGPKSPFCTLFTDHPATSLRVWLWQTWQRRINGILVWDSNYWTSPTAFPDSLQNPYEDAMSYRTGYGQKPGTKAYWGNGDGRFLYPPPAAARGSEHPILEGPVSSLRWELLREGVEDVDYLYLLEVAVSAAKPNADAALLARAKALLTVPPEITRSMTDWTFDSRPIYEHRRKVAAMIEKLAR